MKDKKNICKNCKEPKEDYHTELGHCINIRKDKITSFEPLYKSNKIQMKDEAFHKLCELIRKEERDKVLAELAESDEAIEAMINEYYMPNSSMKTCLKEAISAYKKKKGIE